MSYLDWFEIDSENPKKINLDSKILDASKEDDFESLEDSTPSEAYQNFLVNLKLEFDGSEEDFKILCEDIKGEGFEFFVKNYYQREYDVEEALGEFLDFQRTILRREETYQGFLDNQKRISNSINIPSIKQNSIRQKETYPDKINDDMIFHTFDVTKLDE